MAQSKVISSDSHVVEPPNVWMERMDRDRFGSRIPHMVNVEEIDAWIVDNKETGGVGAIAQAGLQIRPARGYCVEGQPSTTFVPAGTFPKNT